MLFNELECIITVFPSTDADCEPPIIKKATLGKGIISIKNNQNHWHGNEKTAFSCFLFLEIPPSNRHSHCFHQASKKPAILSLSFSLSPELIIIFFTLTKSLTSALFCSFSFFLFQRIHFLHSPAFAELFHKKFIENP